MRICTIASSSAGNCIYVGSRKTHLLVDVGISKKRIEEGLKNASISLSDINGMIITHEHIDHIRSLGVIARKYGIPVYTAEDTMKAIARDSRVGEIPSGIFKEVTEDKELLIGDISVRPFRISHDAVHPLGFRFECEGKSFAVATDMGCYDDYTVKNLSGLDNIVVEANHDIHMLEAGAYPYYLKERILSSKGHLSNDATGHLLENIIHDKMQHIILGHLSKENNYPLLAYETVAGDITFGDNPFKAADFDIRIAGRDQVGELIEW